MAPHASLRLHSISCKERTKTETRTNCHHLTDILSKTILKEKKNTFAYLIKEKNTIFVVIIQKWDNPNPENNTQSR